MKPFFLQSDRQQALERAARRWENTPYFPNAASCGYGVGCVNLVHELWIEAGAIPRLELPAYQTDYAHHSTHSQLIRFLLDHPALAGRLLFVPFQAPKLPGDLYGVRSGRVDHHLACSVMHGKIVQAVERHGVIIIPDNEEAFAKRVLYVLRLMER